MKRKIKENCDIKALSELLTPENKQYVIAVANALIFTQKPKYHNVKKENDLNEK